MLREEIIQSLKEKVKVINKEKSVEERLRLMIIILEETRAKINDELDDIFAMVNLKKKKLNIHDLDDLD